MEKKNISIDHQQKKNIGENKKKNGDVTRKCQQQNATEDEELLYVKKAQNDTKI